MTIFTSFLFLILSNSLFASSDAALKMELFNKVKEGHQTLSYRDARVLMFNEIYLEENKRGFYIQGVYCEDKFYPFHGKNPAGRIPDHKYLNTEHTWPQSKFSSFFNKDTQKSDLHHLYPTASGINSQRSNLPFAEVNDEQDSMFCDESDIGSALSTGTGTYFEPADSHKGNVARSLFYFSIRYQMPIDAVQEEYLRLWHKEDPVDAKERARHELIAKYQKNRNPFIDRPELVDQIQDF